MTSTLLAGCSAPATPVATMTAIMTASIAPMIMTQRFSVRTTTASGTTPSRSGRRDGFDDGSANGASRHEEEEVERHPPDKEQPDRDGGNDERADWAGLERFGGIVRPCGGGDVLHLIGGGLMWDVGLHWFSLPVAP